MSQKIQTIRLAATVALTQALSLVEELHPGGKVRKSEYITCNSLRGDSKPSLHINLNTGKANDVASPDYHYGDLVAIAADVWGVNQYRAARMILERFGYVEPGHSAGADPAHRERVARLQAKAQRRIETEARQKQEREEYVRRVIVPKLWHTAVPEAKQAGQPHPYLRKKNVEGHNTRRVPAWNGGYDLLIPVCDGGTLINLQIINPKGLKRFIKGGRVSGCYSPIGRVTQTGTLYICEGWATGATLQEYYGGAVACAMFAANLEPVARKLREHYGPDQHIVIAGDDDRGKRTNAGRSAATRAAEAIGADLIFPEFPASAPASLSDFNDLHVYQIGQGREVSHG
ncbi:toprim domain-containing protein [Marinobacter sp.]|uniref:toprim domain-containing protein n=1 Tax=Marinobacter sp. TaxID=50741 RepID=UPI00384C19E1